MIAANATTFDSGLLLAALMAIAVILAKIGEKAIEWVVKKLVDKKDAPQTATILTLDAETSRLIHEIYDATGDVKEIASLRDTDGIPLVYNPRSALDMQEKMVEHMAQLARSQERTAETLESIVTRLDGHEKKLDEQGRQLADLLRSRDLR